MLESFQPLLTESDVQTLEMGSDSRSADLTFTVDVFADVARFASQVATKKLVNGVAFEKINLSSAEDPEVRPKLDSELVVADPPSPVSSRVHQPPRVEPDTQSETLDSLLDSDKYKANWNSLASPAPEGLSPSPSRPPSRSVQHVPV